MYYEEIYVILIRISPNSPKIRSVLVPFAQIWNHLCIRDDQDVVVAFPLLK